jgi:23S rRNA C2498 (ribose-2'-O)-methylase RlmM
MALDEDDADRFIRQARVVKAQDLIDAASWLRLADDFEELAERERLQRH